MDRISRILRNLFKRSRTVTNPCANKQNTVKVPEQESSNVNWKAVEEIFGPRKHRIKKMTKEESHKFLCQGPFPETGLMATTSRERFQFGQTVRILKEGPYYHQTFSINACLPDHNPPEYFGLGIWWREDELEFYIKPSLTNSELQISDLDLLRRALDHQIEAYDSLAKLASKYRVHIHELETRVEQLMKLSRHLAILAMAEVDDTFGRNFLFAKIDHGDRALLNEILTEED